MQQDRCERVDALLCYPAISGPFVRSVQLLKQNGRAEIRVIHKIAEPVGIRRLCRQDRLEALPGKTVGLPKLLRNVSGKQPVSARKFLPVQAL